MAKKQDSIFVTDLHGPLEAEALQAPVKSTAAQTERACGLADVPTISG